MSNEKKYHPNYGGAREGAGRPPKYFRLERGRRVLVHTKCEEGVTQGQLAEVVLVGNSRNRTLILRQENGVDIIVTL
jgi:hypothetical protein